MLNRAERFINNRKQDKILSTTVRPTTLSLREGEEIIHIAKGKPLARYRKENGMLWVSYMSRDGNMLVDNDIIVEGNITGKKGLKIDDAPIINDDGEYISSLIPASGKTADFSSATLTTSTSQKNSIVSGIDSGTITKAKVNTSGTWPTADIPNLNASIINAGVLGTTYHSAHVTDNLDANGLKAGRNIGDAIKRVNVYSGSSKNTQAGNADDATTLTDLYWRQSDTTYVKKVEFNYVHDPDILSLAMFCNLYQADAASTINPTAYARLVVYEIVAGGTSPIAASATIANGSGAVAEISTMSTTYVPLETGKVDVSGLDPADGDILYRAAIELKSNSSDVTAHMTGVAVVAWGA